MTDEQAMCREFGKRLQEARLRMGLTQARVAVECAVSRSAYGDYERGQRWPGSAFLVCFAELTKCEIEDLFAREKADEEVSD